MPKFNVGDRVIKNPATWTWSEFDLWGAGRGVGTVVEHPHGPQYMDEEVDVRWPAGKAMQRVDELLPAPPDAPLVEYCRRCDQWHPNGDPCDPEPRVPADHEWND